MKTLVKLFFLGFVSFIQAHTIWIETETKAKINQKQEIKIFFGELSKPTPTKRWFSDLNQLELKITYPSGKKEIISQKEQKENYYSSYFTPTEKGIYTIEVNHLVKDTHRDMKITYQSVAITNTEKETKTLTLGTAPLEISFSTSPLHFKEYKNLIFSENKIKTPKDKIKIISETGWEKDYQTDENGSIQFIPIIKGKYLVEYAKPKTEEAMHNGKPYKKHYEMITYLINVL